MPSTRLYTPTFFLGFSYNFILALHFTNNAMYPLFVRSEGGGIALVGLFMGMYSVGAVAGRPLVGYLIDRFGATRVLMLGSLCLSLPALGYVALLGQGFPLLVWPLRILQGFGYGAHFSATFTLAAQIAPPDRRNEAIAMYGVSGLAGAIAGPPLGEWLIASLGIAAFFYVMALIGVLATAVVSFVRLERKRAGFPTPREVIRALSTKEMRFVAVLAFLLAVAYSSPQSFLATVAAERGLAQFSFYFAAWGAGGALIRFVGGSWGDKRGLRRVLLPSFGVYAAGLLLLSFAPSTPVLVAAGLFTGVAHGIAFPAVASLGYAMAPERFTGSAMALVTGMMDVGAAANALAIGALAEGVGYWIVFPVAALAAATAMALLWASIRLHPAPIRPRHES